MRMSFAGQFWLVTAFAASLARCSSAGPLVTDVTKSGDNTLTIETSVTSHSVLWDTAPLKTVESRHFGCSSDLDLPQVLGHQRQKHDGHNDGEFLCIAS
jgi:hypothetical protein